jgi:hypothetical protein
MEASASELELGDVRQTLAYSAQLSNIGRRLGLGAVDPRSSGKPSLDWRKHGHREAQIKGLSEQVAQLQRMARGQTVPARRGDASGLDCSGISTIADEPSSVAGPLSPLPPQPARGQLAHISGKGAPRRRSSEEMEKLNGKIDRMLFELSRLSPRLAGSDSAGAESAAVAALGPEDPPQKPPDGAAQAACRETRAAAGVRQHGPRRALVWGVW